MKVSRGVVVLFAVALACVRAEAAAPRVRVDVRELRARDAWRVTIHYTHAVDGVIFDATRTPFRDGRWKIVRPRGATWSILGGKDAIVFASRQQNVVLEFASDFAPREKDYHVNVPFTDGSRLLYTGHLRTRPLLDVGVVDPAKAIDHDWSFHTDDKRDIRVLSRRGRGNLKWWDTDDDTYVYFGSIAPSEDERLVLIVDPGLPKWVLPQMARFIPQQFAFYAAATGTELNFKPLVLLSYGGAEGPGLSFAGGVLPGVVQIALLGEAWSAESEESSRTWYRHLAHEIFHLWDGQMFRPSEDAEWLSEAAAEYFAVLAMRDAKMIDDEAIEKLVFENTNNCIANLGGKSILAGKFHNYYICGFVIQALVDRSHGGVANVFRCLFANTPPRTRRYTTADFFEVIDHDADIERIVRDGIPSDAEYVFAHAMQAAGFAFSLVPPVTHDATFTRLLRRESPPSPPTPR